MTTNQIKCINLQRFFCEDTNQILPKFKNSIIKSKIQKILSQIRGVSITCHKQQGRQWVKIPRSKLKSQKFLRLRRSARRVVRICLFIKHSKKSLKNRFSTENFSPKSSKMTKSRQSDSNFWTHCTSNFCGLRWIFLIPNFDSYECESEHKNKYFASKSHQKWKVPGFTLQFLHFFSTAFGRLKK